MADICDAAQATEALNLRAALEARPVMPVGPSRTECIDCDGPIPDARRQAVPGVVRCVFCQGQNETRTVGR